MSVEEIIRIVLAVVSLLIGVLLFRYAGHKKEFKQEIYAKYGYYCGLLWFIGAALLAYIPSLTIAITMIISCIVVGSGLLFYGKLKQTK